MGRISQRLPARVSSTAPFTSSKPPPADHPTPRSSTDRIIALLAGPDRVRFYTSAPRLAYSSPHFSSQLDTQQEDDEIPLPTTDPATVHAFITFLDKQQLWETSDFPTANAPATLVAEPLLAAEHTPAAEPAPAVEGTPPFNAPITAAVVPLTYPAIISIAIFATTHLIPSLHNAAINALFTATIQRWPNAPPPDTVVDVYLRTPPGAPLRRLFLETAPCWEMPDAMETFLAAVGGEGAVPDELWEDLGERVVGFDQRGGSGGGELGLGAWRAAERCLWHMHWSAEPGVGAVVAVEWGREGEGEGEEEGWVARRGSRVEERVRRRLVRGRGRLARGWERVDRRVGDGVEAGYD